MKRSPLTRSPWIVQAEDLPAGQRYCTCCEKPLAGTVIMLELDQRIDEYHDCEQIPEDVSQGAFPFGPTCARKAREKAQKALLCLARQAPRA